MDDDVQAETSDDVQVRTHKQPHTADKMMCRCARTNSLTLLIIEGYGPGGSNRARKKKDFTCTEGPGRVANCIDGNHSGPRAYLCLGLVTKVMAQAHCTMVRICGQAWASLDV
eukprot:1146433-Pelagomonas_calceolata.AAC.2